MSLWYPHRHSAAPGFSSLFRMLDDFEKYAQHHIPGQIGSTTSGGLTFNPKFDVAEHDKEYTLQGELPGVPPENVVIEFTDPQTLVIRGHAERQHTEGDASFAGRLGAPEEKKIEGKVETSTSKEVKKDENGEKTGESGPKYWLSERSFGEFSRVFSFPASVDQDKVEAKFNHGVLNITVPKLEKKGSRRIDIK